MGGRDSRARTFSGRREATIGLGMYAIYLLVRVAVVNDKGRAQARRNAERIVAAERRLRIHVEPGSNRPPPRARLIVVLNVTYVIANVGLTVGWLARLFFRASRIPSPAARGRPDDSGCATGLSALPNRPPADARPLRRHDRRGQRLRPRLRPDRQALRPHCRDAVDPRRLRGGHCDGNCRDESQPSRAALSRRPIRRLWRSRCSRPRTTTSSTQSRARPSGSRACG